MKNTLKIMLFVAFATFAFTSCNKENTPAVQQDTVLDITMDYANFSGNDTKGTKTTWANGDLVYLTFSETGVYNEFDFKNYVKMQFNGTKWKVVNTEGQTVLNKLPVGKGKVDACHHTGLTDPILSTDISGNEENVFPNDNEACFAISAEDIEYTKTTGKITAALKFKPRNTFQFNIKGLDFVEGKYCLNIYKESQMVTNNLFGKFLFDSYGVGAYPGHNEDIPAQKGFNNSVDKEISFFVSFWDYQLEGFYTINSDGIYTYTFNPTFELGINIDGDGTAYYAIRTITGKTYTEYNAYSLKGPSKTDAEIKAATSGADLGNGWTKK